MASVFLFVFFLLLHFLLLQSAQGEMKYTQKCPSFTCGNLHRIGFPFTTKNNRECGLFTVDCGKWNSTIQLERGGRSYPVFRIIDDKTLHIADDELPVLFTYPRCESLTNLSFPSSSFFSFQIVPSQTFFKCNRTLHVSAPPDFEAMPCGNYHIYYNTSNNIYYNTSNESFPGAFSGCSIIQLPNNWLPDGDDPFPSLNSEFDLEVHVSHECYECFQKGGQCKARANGKFLCDGAKNGLEKKKINPQKITLGLEEKKINPQKITLGLEEKKINPWKIALGLLHLQIKFLSKN